MKKKLSILAFGLLLAVGWTNVASAQKAVGVPANQVTDISKLKVQLAPAQMNTSTAEEDAVIASGDYQRGGALYAPQRAANNYTTPVVKPRSFYEGFNYTWMNGTSPETANLTDVVTNPDQMWYLLKYIYNTAAIPGPWYNKAYETTQTYPGFAYGWEDRDVTMPTNIVINLSSSYANIFYIDFYDITNTDSLFTLTATDLYNNYGCSRTTFSYGGSNYYIAYISGGGNITIPLSSLPAAAQNGVVLHIAAVRDSNTYSGNISVNGGTAQSIAYNTPQEYYFTVSPGTSTGTVTDAPFPTENGHTICLVKVKNNDNTAPTTTSTYNDLTTIFNDYVESIELLTDGLRVDQDGESQAGTVFTYSGMLNKFFFIGKSKLAKFGYQAPFYGMYEEYSPTTTATGDEITDFYSKMLEGDSYGIVHDCSSVIYRKHSFSMTGNAGTEEKSLTNLIFYIPDERGRSPYDSIGNTYNSRNYELRPQVGLYTITLTAEARPAANYSETNRKYDVTCNWISSLNTIVDTEVPQTYELWIFVYDENGNPVPVPETDGGLIYKGPNTTYTYQVPQYPDSYTIIYRVKGWPTNATNSPEHGGDFYAWSNLDDVLIPGYKDFLSLNLGHYESDFKIDEEHNYYRNFMTVDNQNPDNALTAQRVLDGENLFELYRYDVANENTTKVKAAELKFYQRDNEIRYKVDYFDQQILSGYELPMTTPVKIDTAGVVATISGGSTTDGVYTKVTSAADLTSGQYLIVCENNNVAFDGSLTTLDAGHNVIDVTITDNTIPANATTDASSFTLDITNGTGTIKSASGYYIGRNASSNGLDAKVNTQYSNTFSMNGTDAVIRGAGNYQLRFNSSSGDNNYRFRYYNGTNQAIQLYKRSTTGAKAEPNRSFILLDSQIDNQNYAGNNEGIISPSAPWVTSGLYYQDNTYFYIQRGGNLKFTVPAGYNGADLKFILHNSNNTYYSGTFTFTPSTGTAQTINCNTQDQDYEVDFSNVNSGDVITITGMYTSASYSPDFSSLYVYIDGGSHEVDLNTPLYLSEIQIVDQFKAETKNDKHPYRYGYFLQYTGSGVGSDTTKTSSVQEVPVQHTGATLGGYYTLQQIQDDEYATLDTLVMNAQVNMNLANNPAIYYYTLDRKPSNVTDAEWDEISQLQIRTDGTYQEIDEKLTQYIEQVCEPGIVPRYDNETYSVLYGNHNDYMSYAPIVWTHGDLSNNKRIKWESEKRHNSYGAPIWKTGVGDVKILSADSWRQQGKYGSTNWVDENNDSCSLYFLEVTAQGFLPTNNTVGNENGFVPYVPYWFNVYAVSKSGQLRGYSQVGTPGVDPDSTGSAGSHLVNNPEKNRYIWRVYGGRTTDGYLEKHLSNTWADNFAFGALNNISDLQIVVRFYYVVNGMIQSTDYVMDRDGAPAGYGAESPGKSPEPHTGIIEVLNPNHGNVVKTTYVNPQGLQSDKPFDGVNIVINRYEDGTTSTSKVIR